MKVDMTEKIALMGDVHANPRALEAAVADAKALGCSRLLFLGDATGYGYDVKTTLRLLRENFAVLLMGNHDAVASDRFPRELGNHNFDVDRAQAQQLNESELEYLRGLPLVYAEEDIACVHGDFTNPRGFKYIQTAGEAQENCCARDERFLFCAHLHLSSVWEIEEDATVTRKTEVRMQPISAPETDVVRVKADRRYVINVGSVGHPRCESSIVYAILDREAQSVSIRRLPFDFDAYKKDMARAGLAIPAWME